MVFGYSEALKEIREKSPFLNFAVVPLPHTTSPENRFSYPRYWGYTVSRQSKNASLAWDFIINLTTNPTVAKTVTDSVKQPPALLANAAEYQNDPDLGSFVNQALTARTWPQTDPEGTEKAFKEMIEAVIVNKSPVETAIGQAQNKVTQLMQEKSF
jgi:maltose-binding protein MalE